MRNYCFTILWLILISYACRAQTSVNLVPNPSFEVYDTCPVFLGQIYYAPPWFQPNNQSGNLTNGGSTDYFLPCSTNPSAGVPTNFIGYQYARTGLGYAGLCPLFARGTDGGREYMEVELDSTLKPGKKYCVSFYVSLSNGGKNPIDLLSAYFSNDSAIYSSSSYDFFPVIPQINNPTGKLLDDTLNWMEVKGILVATGGERFMTIGNFYPGSMTQSIPADSLFATYYYIDDVSVSEAPIANAGSVSDTLCAGDRVNIGSTARSGYQYNWFPTAGLSAPTSANTFAAPLQTTTYTLVVADGCCATCTDTSRVTIHVKPCYAPITPPNIFTPNGDGVNDAWAPRINTPTGFSAYHCTILNRWGIKLFDTKNALQEWDGRDLTGTDCTDGVYYYVISATTPDGKTSNLTGFFELWR
jgi:gliding motility-associated-like protein